MFGVCSTWIRCHFTNNEIPVVKMSRSDDRYHNDVNVSNWKGLYFGTDILPYSLIKQRQNHTFFNSLFLTIYVLNQNEVKIILFIHCSWLYFYSSQNLHHIALQRKPRGAKMYTLPSLAASAVMPPVTTKLASWRLLVYTVIPQLHWSPWLVITSHHCMSHKCFNSLAPTVPIALHSNTLIHISKYFNLLFRNPYYKCGTLQCAWPGSTQMYADTSPYRNPQDNSRVPNAQCRFVNWNLFSIVMYTK